MVYSVKSFLKKNIYIYNSRAKTMRLRGGFERNLTTPQLRALFCFCFLFFFFVPSFSFLEGERGWEGRKINSPFKGHPRDFY